MTDGTLQIKSAAGRIVVRVAGVMFPKVEEVMTDMVLMDLVHSSPVFVGELCRHAEVDGNFIQGRRSVFDNAHGETDVEIILDTSSGRHGLLIENKIDAPLMNRQFERYHRRGKRGIDNGAPTQSYSSRRVLTLIIYRLNRKRLLTGLFRMRRSSNFSGACPSSISKDRSLRAHPRREHEDM